MAAKLFGAKPLMKEAIAEPAPLGNQQPSLLKKSFGKKVAPTQGPSLMKRLTGK